MEYDSRHEAKQKLKNMQKTKVKNPTLILIAKRYSGLVNQCMGLSSGFLF